MKKLNFDNNAAHDDGKLINLLKTSTGHGPSEKFAENTLEKFLVLKATQRRVHKPLKAPLYMMLAIGSILLAPVLFWSDPQISPPGSGWALKDFVKDLSFQVDPWYTLSPMILALVLMWVVWMELGPAKFRNPFS